jgi:uncharacterized protein involved in type VI secretion and phage assembly
MPILEEAVVRLAKQAEERRFGKFRAVVTDNQDPQKRARLKLRVAAVLGDQETDWALPCLPYGGGAGYGLFLVPEVNAQVWVEFEEGDLSRPIWTGVFWQASGDVPQDAAKADPTTRLLQTKSGHILQFDDESGKERIRLHHSAGAEVLVDENGTVTLTDANGGSITLDASAGELHVKDANGNELKMTSSGTTVKDANGNSVEMTASGTTVKGQQIVLQGSQVMLGGAGGEPVIKGTSFLALFATHTHPTSMGPSGPPIPQGETSSLSTKVMTS